MFGSGRGDELRAQHRVLALVAGLIVATAACGGGDAPPWGSSPSPTSLDGAQTPSSRTPAPQCTPRQYTVQAGDTMSGIAAAFNVPLEDLVRLNSETIPDPDTLAIGQAVNIPCPRPTNNGTATPAAASPSVTSGP